MAWIPFDRKVALEGSPKNGCWDGALRGILKFARCFSLCVSLSFSPQMLRVLRRPGTKRGRGKELFLMMALVFLLHQLCVFSPGCSSPLEKKSSFALLTTNAGRDGVVKAGRPASEHAQRDFCCTVPSIPEIMAGLGVTHLKRAGQWLVLKSISGFQNKKLSLHIKQVKVPQNGWLWT